MGFLLTYVGTIVSSYLIDLSIALKSMKDACDEGLKYNTKKGDSVIQSSINKSKFIRYIPFINLFNSFKNIIDYSFGKGTHFDSCMVTGIMSHMTKDEYQFYQKNPTLFNAIIICSGQYDNVNDLLSYQTYNIEEIDYSFEYRYNLKKRKYEFGKDSKENLLTDMEKSKFLNEKNDIRFIKLEDNSVVCFSVNEKKRNPKINVVFKVGDCKDISDDVLSDTIYNRMLYIGLLSMSGIINDNILKDGSKDGILDVNYFTKYSDELNKLLSVNDSELTINLNNDIQEEKVKYKTRVRKR